MPTITATYLGDLRTQSRHEQSGSTLLTDAPTDNQGKGEAFSPTDLVATALASCILTLMGIYANTHGLDIKGTTVSANKIMAENPRRIKAIEIVLNLPARDYPVKHKRGLELAAHGCPVLRSLHPDMEKKLTFVWA